MMSATGIEDFKIADFGLATQVKAGLTLRCGSPGYIAPEILRKQTYNCKADVFSIGVICFIMLTGQTPFYGHSP